MAYSKGNKTQASDLNSYTGAYGVTTAYPSSSAATNAVAALLGIGYGDRGYGQTSPAVNPFVAGTNWKASDMVNLVNAIQNMATYQGSTVSLPAASSYVSGGSGVAFDFSSAISTIDTNRLTAAAASLALTSGALTISRATTWGSGSIAPGDQIICEMTAAFATEDAARFFFNSGGQLTSVLAHPNTSTTQDTNWNTVLSALGTISVGAHATTRSGSGGTPKAIGYYELTGAYQTIFDGTNIGTGSYTSNSVLVEGMYVSRTGTNGANGTTVKIRITLTDGHANSFSDLVQSGTNASFGYKKASATLTGIASPTFTKVTNF